MTERHLGAAVAPRELLEPLRELRAELGIPEEFSAQALAEAEAASRRPPVGTDRTAIPFVTIDPPGSLDLDQAVHLESHGVGFRVRYAIAAVGRVVEPGTALEAEVHARGVTVYGPGHSFPLHPRVLSAGAASLLPEVVRSAYLWTMDLDSDGLPTRTTVELARVRSVARLTYAEVQRAIDSDSAGGFAALFHRIGRLRQQIEADRGGVSLDIPEQIVERADGYRLSFRGTTPAEGYNAQISLLTGMEAARLMRAAGIGVFRTLPEAEARDVARLRRCARALKLSWPSSMGYPEFVRSLDSSRAAHAAFLDQATTLFRGAGYRVFDDGAPPDPAPHAAINAEYAHVTAPLRRLVDRFGLEICLAHAAGTDVPEHIRAGLAGLPRAMATATQRANAYERGALNVMEALVLKDHVGEIFTGVVVDVENHERGTVLVEHPAVEAVVYGADLPIGEAVRVRLVEADPASRTVRFELS